MLELFRPEVSELSARLAADNARVTRFLDGLTTRIDQLVKSTTIADWHAVRHMSDAIAEDSRTNGNIRLTECAEQVRDVAQTAENPAHIKKSVIHLVGAFGSARVNAPAGK